MPGDLDEQRRSRRIGGSRQLGVACEEKKQHYKLKNGESPKIAIATAEAPCKIVGLPGRFSEKTLLSISPLYSDSEFTD